MDQLDLVKFPQKSGWISSDRDYEYIPRGLDAKVQVKKKMDG